MHRCGAQHDDMTDDACDDMADDASDDTGDDASEDVPNDTCDDMADDASDDMADDASEDVPNDACDDMADDASDDVTNVVTNVFERGMTFESDTSVSSDDSDCESPSDLEGHVGHTCEGGQFCWEDDVMVKVNGAWYPGVYEGYGYAMIRCPEGRQPFDQTAGEMVLLREFEEFFGAWGFASRLSVAASGTGCLLQVDGAGRECEVATDIQCRSCFGLPCHV